jgi:hypothetical protein
MRYEQMVVQGYAIKRVPVPTVNVPYGIQPGTDEQRAQAAKDCPKQLECGIRILGPGEDCIVDELTSAYALAHGVEKYDDINPICVKARMMYTLATACVDPDSDPRAPILFWGDTVEDGFRVLHDNPKHDLTPEIITFLHEHFLLWQDELNPQANTFAEAKMVENAQRAVDDADFLASLRPGLRMTWLRTMAAQWLASVAVNYGATSSPSKDASERPRKPSPQKKPKRKLAAVRARTAKSLRRK